MADVLTLLHTSPVHVARFDALRDRIAPGQALRHVVRPDWLARARLDGDEPALQTELAAEVTHLCLCTCTTLGVMAEELGAVRIDRPMMELTSQIGGKIALAYCVASTAVPSLALFADVAIGTSATAVPVPLTHAWALFEAGDQTGYAQAIAAGVRDHLASHPDTTAVILAQASMDVARPLLTGLRVPVFDPAEPALRAVLERSARRTIRQG